MVAQGHIPSQLGKTVVITGATGGLGYETALALAKAGAEVVLTGRDDRKGQLAIEKISREASGARIVFESLDPARLQSIADFAQRMRSRQSLDLLINNAGVMAQPRRQVTADVSRCNSEQTIWATSPIIAWVKRRKSRQRQQSGAPDRLHRFQ